MAASLDRVARQILAWLVPALLTAVVSVLWGIQAELRRISESLAVTMVRIDLMERRIDMLDGRVGVLERVRGARARP